MKIILIRHGKTLGNTQGRYLGRTDEPLLEGEANGLHPENIRVKADAIYSSPMLRCRQTAAILFPDMSDEICPWDGLQEMDFGEFEYKNYKELNGDPRYQKWIDDGGIGSFPGGEDLYAFRKRCREAFADLCKDAKERGHKTIAVVVHGGTIMSVMDAYGDAEKSFYDWQPKNGCGYTMQWDEDTESDMILTDITSIGTED